MLDARRSFYEYPASRIEYPIRGIHEPVGINLMTPDKKIKLFTTTIITACLLFNSGCGPSYTKENYLDALKDMCRKAYGIDVKVKRVGGTTGIYLPLEGLFQTTFDPAAEDINVQEALASIQFKEDAAKKIDHVSLAISRVALSADAPTDFYVLTADDANTGIRIVITRYVSDIRRLMLGDISRGDYFKRLLMDVEFNPSVFSESLIRQFFYDMRTMQARRLLGKYFSQSATAAARESLSDFFLLLEELDYKKEKKFEVTDIKSKRIAVNRMLVYCKVKEDYLPKDKYGDFEFRHPRGFEAEYLISVNTFYFPYMIEKAMPLLRIDEYGALRRNIPDGQLAEYGRPEEWDPEDFYLEEVKFTDFLAKQLGVRVRNLYQAAGRPEEGPRLDFVKCEYRQTDKAFSIVMDLRGGRDAAPAKEEDFSGIWTIVCDVMRRYEFEDFRGVEIRNLFGGRHAFLTREDIMQRFWPKWLRRQKRGRK